MKKINNFFKLEENKTTVRKEFVAGLTTFFAMAYILVAIPAMLSIAGMNPDAVFLAVIIAIIVGTLIMGLFANVPYALAPGIGLTAFFVYTVCGAFGFSWQEALAMVFICGIINIFITVTKIRKSIIAAIPKSLQTAIGGGIGIFIAYIGLLNAEIIVLEGGKPAFSLLNSQMAGMAILGIIVTIVLLVKKVPGAILIGIITVVIVNTIINVTIGGGIDFEYNVGAPFGAINNIFGKVFTEGFPGLFSDMSRIGTVLLMIFAFSLTDTFDTIGTFIGTGRKSGIFTEEELTTVGSEKGFNTKMEKALFADSIATSIAAIIGTTNTTTYVESAAGIESGGRTGLTSVFVALFFGICIFLSPLMSLVTYGAIAGALVAVGIMMASSLKDIEWNDLEEAIPAFFAVVLMPLAYNIATGIAFAFISYVIIKVAKKKFSEINLIMWITSILFILYYVFTAIS